MVKSVTYFVSEEFNDRTYESCKNVQFPAQSDTVMGLLCGAYGSKKCTAKRFVRIVRMSLSTVLCAGGLTIWAVSPMATHHSRSTMNTGSNSHL